MGRMGHWPFDNRLLGRFATSRSNHLNPASFGAIRGRRDEAAAQTDYLDAGRGWRRVRAAALVAAP